MRFPAAPKALLKVLMVFLVANPLVAAGPLADEQEPAPTQERLTSTDVALTSNGLLAGQVYNAKGQAMPGAQVLLFDATGQAIKGVTNERGQFAYAGVSSGVYYLQAGGQVQVARVWPSNIAPPSAKSGVLLIGDPEVVRGQYHPPSGFNAFVAKSKRVMTNPLAVAGVVATAVAIPVAIHNADDGS